MVAAFTQNGSPTRLRHLREIVVVSSGARKDSLAVCSVFSATISHMRKLMPLILAGTLWAQSALRIQISHTTESLRGVSAVSRQIAWASGTHGTYLRTTDGGRKWIARQVPDVATLDFRAVVAFSADEAFLMSAGPGEQSRIYHTSDAGQHWQLQFTNTNPKGFFDSMAFWDPKHGVALGDPIPDESGKLKFEILLTDDGQTWHTVPPAQLPPALEGEGAFAASNTCLAILPNVWRNDNVSVPGAESNAVATGQLDFNIWFATGGSAARVFHSPDAGKSWQVFDTPLNHGPDSAGIFSIAFRNSVDGVIAGGDYKHHDRDGPNLAFTHDGGKTWDLSTIHPQAYFSAVAYDHKSNADARRDTSRKMRAESKGEKAGADQNLHPRLFIVGQDFVLDLRPPNDPKRIAGKKKLGTSLNAISVDPEGGALLVGSKGSIAFIP
jgi:photosystem II stability/assembly factor-like uncharacterized protein